MPEINIEEWVEEEEMRMVKGGKGSGKEKVVKGSSKRRPGSLSQTQRFDF